MNWLRKLLGMQAPVKSDLQVFLEHQTASEERYHARIEQLIETLDKVVSARFDKPIIERGAPNVISSPLPYEALTDILGYEDDSAFVAAAQKVV